MPRIEGDINVGSICVALKISCRTVRTNVGCANFGSLKIAAFWKKTVPIYKLFPASKTLLSYLSNIFNFWCFLEGILAEILQHSILNVIPNLNNVDCHITTDRKLLLVLNYIIQFWHLFYVIGCFLVNSLDGSTQYKLFF